jgi:hypothetical protein
LNPEHQNLFSQMNGQPMSDKDISLLLSDAIQRFTGQAATLEFIRMII